MAAVNFRIRTSTTKNVSIKVYLSTGRGNYIETTTGFNINPVEWSTKTNRPKQGKPENKNLTADLNRLDTFIRQRLNVDSGTSVEIDLGWLKNCIRDCFSRIEKVDTSLVSNHIQSIIDNAATRKGQISKKLGLSISRINGYKTFKKNFERFQDYEKKKIHFSNVNQDLIDRFTVWLLDVEKYSVSYAGKHIDNLKTVCLDAEKRGIVNNPFFRHIESFTEADDDRFIITLSTAELSKIQQVQLSRPALDNARNWILLGCEIGQRGGDLLRLTPEALRYVKDNIGDEASDMLVIDVVQEKGNKFVTAPILSPNVIEIVLNRFPYAVATQKLNEYIKEVCELAGINEMIEGKKMNPATKRKEKGTYPKYELIVSHSFRRSFSTENHKIMPVNAAMLITGHSRENTFRTYINKRQDRDDQARQFASYRKIALK